MTTPLDFETLEIGERLGPVGRVLAPEMNRQRLAAAQASDSLIAAPDGRCYIDPTFVNYQHIFLLKQKYQFKESVHAKTDVQFHDTLLLEGDRVVIDGYVAAKYQRRGGEYITVQSFTRTMDGQLAVEAKNTFLLSFRKKIAQNHRDKAVIVSPVSDLSGLAPTVTFGPIDLQLQHLIGFGDAENSVYGLWGPNIHNDPEVAKAQGHRGPIAQGRYWLTMVSATMSKLFGLAWLRTGSLRAAYLRPTSPGESVSAKIWLTKREPVAAGCRLEFYFEFKEGASGRLVEGGTVSLVRSQ